MSTHGGFSTGVLSISTNLLIQQLLVPSGVPGQLLQSVSVVRPVKPENVPAGHKLQSSIVKPPPKRPIGHALQIEFIEIEFSATLSP